MTTERILFSESSPNLGGQELQLLQQMTLLKARGLEVRLACRRGSRIADVARERQLDTVAVPFRNSLDLKSIAALVRLLRAWRPDVIVSHSGHDANNCALAARLVAARPRLIRMRTYQPGPPHAWTYNALADLTLVPSAAMRSSLLAHPRIKSERIRVLYPGLDFERIEREAQTTLPEAIANWLERRPGPLLVQAAMLRAEKGHALMLSVVAQLIETHPALRYLIAGEGELHEALSAQVRELGLEQHVLIAGLVPQVAPLYRRADLVLMPSSYEPLGMSQSEALSLGVPVLASRTGGIPETIEDHRSGLLVEPENVSEWIRTISWALAHPSEMRRMAAVGREFVKTRFSMNANIDSLFAHLTPS